MKRVLGRGLALTLIGSAFGPAMAFVLARFLSSLLFSVPQNDPRTFFIISLCLGAIALPASYILTRKAMRADPMVALRNEYRRARECDQSISGSIHFGCGRCFEGRRILPGLEWYTHARAGD